MTTEHVDGIVEAAKVVRLAVELEDNPALIGALRRLVDAVVESGLTQ